MKKSVIKLVALSAVVAFIVFGILIASNLMERENIVDRISTWPALDSTTLDGMVVSTSDLLDGTPVILTYFNTECIYCQQKFAGILADGQLQHEATLVFVSDEIPEIVRAFQEEMGLDQEPGFVFLYDENRSIRNHFGIRSVPASFIYSKEGKLTQFYRGLVQTEELRSHITDDR